MPDPSQLKVGDRVRIIAVPEEWSRPGFFVHRDSRAFMQAMIKRRFPSRVFKIDADGVPWIRARTKVGDRLVYHEWDIRESTGWKRIEPR